MLSASLSVRLWVWGHFGKTVPFGGKYVLASHEQAALFSARLLGDQLPGVALGQVPLERSHRQRWQWEGKSRRRTSQGGRQSMLKEVYS